jgi:hypothetical protein
MAETTAVVPSAPQTTGSDSQAPAPADARSLQQPSSDLNAKIQSARTPAEVRALLRTVPTPNLNAPKTEATPPVGQPPATQTPPDLQNAEGNNAPAETETPAAEQEVEETTAESETPTTPEPEAEEETDDEADGPLKVPTSKQLRISPAQQDQVGRLTLAIMKRNRDLPMEQAMEMARSQLGIKPQVAEAKPEATPDKSKPSLPMTVEAVDQALETMESEREKALAELRFEDVGKIDRQIRAHDRHRLNLERQAERQQQEAATSYDRDFSAAESKAVELYEFAGNPESPGAQRMREIEAQLRANEDPLYYAANKPLKIAQMVAAEMNIAPRRKGATTPPAKAAAPVPAPKPKQVIPTGSSRTVVPTANQKPAIEADIAKIGPRDVRGLQNLLKAHGIKRF